MFLIGEAGSVVHNGKIVLPSEYRLKKKKMLLMWKDDKTCFLGETKGALKFASGTEGAISDVEIDSENRLPVVSVKEGQKVRLSGCVSTLEIQLLK
ncbi:MAG: hypothetical protein Q4C59_13450 [Lachnospiraceae bacterium]|nr:hypothetical protein [Lachnospiraceae bacterium]